jgi:hypothetical protein
MWLETFKLIIPFLSGGVAGAILNEWLRRRSNRLQQIPLIERVNRLVTPELKGFTLARVAGESHDRHLEEVGNLREYQMTLRNTSSVHLRDVEIQFEFPVEDVQEWASRPKLSKTALQQLPATPSEPWKKAFRWKIPHLPATDSLEFSFSAIDSPAEGYEVALYNADRVVIDISKGEPATKGSLGAHWVAVASLGIFASFVSTFVSGLLVENYGDRTSLISGDGCRLTVDSRFSGMNAPGTVWPWADHSPWEIRDRVSNVGSQKCVFQLPDQQPGSVDPGRSVDETIITPKKPSKIDTDISFGTDKATEKAPVSLYRIK